MQWKKEEFEDEMGQETNDEDLARAVTASEDCCVNENEGAPETFIGVAADQDETCVKVVDSEPRRSESQQEPPVHQCRSSNVSDIDPEMETPWSLAGLQAEQRKDPHINFIIQKFEESESQPAWDIVALESETVKALWAQWLRLSIRDGLLKRRFETPDGHSVHWQIVWPESLRTEFLEVAHSGHFGRRRLTLAVQSRAYWPSWLSDVDRFVKRCGHCACYRRGANPRRGGI